MTRREFIGSGIGAMSIAAIGSPKRGRLGSRNVYDIAAHLPYDSEVEYLEGTGTQWIDTGVNTTLQTGYEIRMAYTSLSHGQYMGAIYGSNPYQRNALGISKAGGEFYVYYGNATTVAVGFGAADYDFHTWRLETSNSPLVLFDGNKKVVFPLQTYNLGLNFWLYRRNATDSSLQQYSNARIVFAKIYDGATLIRDFIPVRFTNENISAEGAMFDRVSGQLFRNQGTGSFIIGPDV